MKMKLEEKLWPLVALLGLSLSAAALADGKKRVLLAAGLQKTIQLDFDPCANPSECIRIGNKLLSEVQYSPEKRQLILTPLRPGETTLVVRNAKGDIGLELELLVSDVNVERQAEELAELLRGMRGVKVSILGKLARIDGVVTSLGDLARIRQILADAQFSTALCLVTPSEQLHREAARQIQEKLAEAGIKVTAWPASSFVLEGTVASPERAAELTRLADKLARAMGFHVAQGEDLIISKLSAKSR